MVTNSPSLRERLDAADAAEHTRALDRLISDIGSYETPPLVRGGQGRTDGELRDAVSVYLVLCVACLLTGAAIAGAALGVLYVSVLAALGVVGCALVAFALMQPPKVNTKHIDTKA